MVNHLNDLPIFSHNVKLTRHDEMADERINRFPFEEQKQNLARRLLVVECSDLLCNLVSSVFLDAFTNDSEYRFQRISIKHSFRLARITVESTE